MPVQDDWRRAMRHLRKEPLRQARTYVASVLAPAPCDVPDNSPTRVHEGDSAKRRAAVQHVGKRELPPQPHRHASPGVAACELESSGLQRGEAELACRALSEAMSAHAASTWLMRGADRAATPCNLYVSNRRSCTSTGPTDCSGTCCPV